LMTSLNMMSQLYHFGRRRQPPHMGDTTPIPREPTFYAVRSYISTVWKHAHNVIDAMYNALTGNPFIPYALEGV